jgi:hypothetical protein
MERLPSAADHPPFAPPSAEISDSNQVVTIRKASSSTKVLLHLKLTGLSMDSLLAYDSSSSDSERDHDNPYVAPSHCVSDNVSGLFPTFVFFPVVMDSTLRVTIDDALDALNCIVAEASPLDDLHITISGTLMLRRDQVRSFSVISVQPFLTTLPNQCDGFLRILGNRLLEIASVDASLCSVVMLPSKDATSSFAAFPLQISSIFFRSVCLAVDAACTTLSLPSQSLSPMPHLSFARIHTPTRDTPAFKLPRGSKVPLRFVNVKIGNRKHILPLSK